MGSCLESFHLGIVLAFAKAARQRLESVSQTVTTFHSSRLAAVKELLPVESQLRFHKAFATAEVASRE